MRNRSYCYKDPSTADPALGSTDLAKKLKYKLGGADGYFLGVLPSTLCPGAGSPEVLKILVTIDFRLASGIQYDRSYAFKIGDVMVSECESFYL
jgi:hypothetical protein